MNVRSVYCDYPKARGENRMQESTFNQLAHKVLELGCKNKNRELETPSGKIIEGVVRINELKFNDSYLAQLEAAVIRLASIGLVRQLFIGYINDDSGVSYVITDVGVETFFDKEKLISIFPLPKSNEVFVIMSFSNNSMLIDSYATVKRACKEIGYNCYRVDEINENRKITEMILESIKVAPFIIADLTEERPNVYYELGYAHALGKEAFQICHKNTPINFDIKDYPTIIYESQTELEERLVKRIMRFKR